MDSIIWKLTMKMVFTSTEKDPQSFFVENMFDFHAWGDEGGGGYSLLTRFQRIIFQLNFQGETESDSESHFESFIWRMTDK